ncbi:MAG: hypothetical protein J3Q66DRAFT_387967 [Benniella sp.]|nr:MAG: hypothetical protein J3Q66DRAFT_387967 [Benniella sp.]
MPYHVSIFDLPHITENIGLYLDIKDLRACALVSQEFYAHFQPLLWRQLVFERYPPRLETMPMSPSHKQALLKNLRHTRRLHVHSRMRYEGVLALVASQCQNLRELHSRIYATKEDNLGVASFWEVLRMLRANPRLESWFLTAWEGVLGLRDRRRMMSAISTSSHLTHLHLKLSYNPHRGWLNYVLQSLPVIIQKIDFQWGRILDDGIWDSLKVVEESPKTYPYLVTVDLKVMLAAGEEEALFKFVQQCPVLKEMTIPKPMNKDVLTNMILRMEAKPFRKESRIAFNTNSVTDISEVQWRRLLLALNDNIREFNTRIAFNSFRARGYMDAMTSCWSRCIESIIIDQAQQISSQDIQLVLTTCYKLKKFDCVFPWIGTMFGEASLDDEGWEEYPGMEAMIRDDDQGKALPLPKWVCADLEDLQLTFSDGRRPFMEEPILSLQEKWAVRGIHHIYSQIGRLTKLQHLTIGWSTSTAFSSSRQLDMSLKSGLDRLRRLKALKVLDVNYLCHLEMGSKEMEWIARNWPRLEKIRGLEYRMDDPEPQYIVKLRQKLPRLQIA